MLIVLRHLLSILLLPFLAVVAMPYWLLASFSANDSRWGNDLFIVWPAWIVGAAVTAVGLWLFIWCVSLFARVGRGTLAPWDPTQKLVAVGPYQFVRNPMISGVALLLISEALFWGSYLVGLWACVFITINHIYFVHSEEPGLIKRFGESYRIYQANVPRWVPRVKPWSGQ